MRSRIVILMLFLFTSLLVGQVNSFNPQTVYERAQKAETAGDLSLALSLYDSLFVAYPQDIRYLTRYKSALLRVGNLDKATEIAQNLYQLNPSNIQYVAELGALKIATGKMGEAFQLWDPYIQRGMRQSRLPQLALMYVTTYNNGNGLPQVITFFREKIKNPLLESHAYFSTLIQRQMWNPALEEFLLHWEKSPRTLPLLVQELKTLPSDAPLYEMILDSLQKKASTRDDYLLLVDLALTAKKYERGMTILSQNSPPLSSYDILNAAQKLFDNSQYSLSLNLLKQSEMFDLKKEEKETVLFLKAKNYEALADKMPNLGITIIPPFHSLFLTLPLCPTYSFDRSYIDSAMMLYETLSHSFVKEEIRYESRINLAQIHLMITGDIDKAANLVDEIPQTLPPALRNTLLHVSVTCKILQNNEKGARQQILEAPYIYSLDAKEEDKIRLNLLLIDLAFNRQDSLEIHLNEALALIDTHDELYNDLLGLATYLQIGAEELGILELESAIQKREWIKGIETAEKLMNQKDPIFSLAAFRLEKLLFLMREHQRLEEFWNIHGDTLRANPAMGDYFTIRYFYYLLSTNNQDMAEDVLLTFLEKWPHSPYCESVRKYLRTNHL
ncbi:MAG: hypothetical protein PHS99_04290 [Candidatus Marinimicrobia bacterium]|nr:hypothetical protein [Candidatus Neomarinimicrobiota bacterium]